MSIKTENSIPTWREVQRYYHDWLESVKDYSLDVYEDKSICRKEFLVNFGGYALSTFTFEYSFLIDRKYKTPVWLYHYNTDTDLNVKVSYNLHIPACANNDIIETNINLSFKIMNVQDSTLSLAVETYRVNSDYKYVDGGKIGFTMYVHS